MEVGDGLYGRGGSGCGRGTDGHGIPCGQRDKVASDGLLGGVRVWKLILGNFCNLCRNTKRSREGHGWGNERVAKGKKGHGMCCNVWIGPNLRKGMGGNTVHVAKLSIHATPYRIHSGAIEQNQCNKLVLLDR